MTKRQSKESKSNDALRTPKRVLRTPDGKLFKMMHSWNTTDDYEIELRRVRAASDENSSNYHIDASMPTKRDSSSSARIQLVQLSL